MDVRYFTCSSYSGLRSRPDRLFRASSRFHFGRAVVPRRNDYGLLVEVARDGLRQIVQVGPAEARIAVEYAAAFVHEKPGRHVRQAEIRRGPVGRVVHVRKGRAVLVHERFRFLRRVLRDAQHPESTVVAVGLVDLVEIGGAELAGPAAYLVEDRQQPAAVRLVSQRRRIAVQVFQRDFRGRDPGFQERHRLLPYWLKL